MIVHPNKVNYWKAVDLLKQDKPDAKTYGAVFLVEEDHVFGYRLYLVACLVRLGTGWQLFTATYSQTRLDEYHYYRLTGALDHTDYDSVEEEHEYVDKFVLAQGRDSVLRISGYWPTYNAAGNRAWHWLAGPDIQPVEDDDEVIVHRLVPELVCVGDYLGPMVPELLNRPVWEIEDLNVDYFLKTGPEAKDD